MKIVPTLVLCLLFLWIPVQSPATETIALDTGHECGFCHLDPAGGGELTASGIAYAAELRSAGAAPEISLASRLFRLGIGYLHILFAVLWFGTILYVHLVLKPSYAVKGLPRGEKLVGIISFWVVGLTGLALTFYRIDSWQTLVESRFGILLLIKVGLYLTMLISAVLVIKIIGPRLTLPKISDHRPGEPFTPATLQSFDGKNGRNCYFAYNGKVYDAGNSRLWPGGEHMKRHAAGTDLTHALALAPHDASVLERLPVVGEFRAAATGKTDQNTRAFFFVAYMNLVIVMLILFIIALWRWGWS